MKMKPILTLVSQSSLRFLLDRNIKSKILFSHITRP